MSQLIAAVYVLFYTGFQDSSHPFWICTYKFTQNSHALFKKAGIGSNRQQYILKKEKREEGKKGRKK
ncbi:hypothetical protein DRN79_02640 [Methanosarcinales archaeon]|nr:MAG: hypothetical protein DRN79_02640 [Methanosarcinales archaeon]